MVTDQHLANGAGPPSSARGASGVINREASAERPILIVSQYFWPEAFRVNDLASELIARGHEVTVLTGLPNYPEGDVFPAYRADPQAFSTYEGASVVRVPMLARGRGHLRLALNYLSFVLGGMLFGPLKLRGREFDAVVVFQTSPITAALPALLLRRLKRAPVLMWVLDLWPETLSAVGVVKSPAVLAPIGALVRFIYRRCDRILVQSRAFFANIALYSDEPGKVRYLPGWAEQVFQNEGVAAEPAPELARLDGGFKVLFAGNVGEAQDFPAIVEAVDLLRNEPGLLIAIVGDGSAAKSTREEIARRGLKERVVFLGRFPLERMPSFFAAADALLVSLRDEPIWAMTIPGKVQSYLASGTPILAMLNGEGARVIEEAEAGLVAPAGDAATLAANVRRLMAMSAQQREALGASGKAYSLREFDRATQITRLEQWIAELRPGDG